jgi:preprotein translocase subunit SecA
MLNPLSFISKFIKSGNQKELDRIDKIIHKINILEEGFSKLKNEDFPKKNFGF